MLFMLFDGCFIYYTLVVPSILMLDLNGRHFYLKIALQSQETKLDYLNYTNTQRSTP
jgi:hypothetical protein